MNVWIFKLFKYNLRFGVAPVNVLKLIRNIHILWLPPTASLDFLCVLKHPHVYPGKPGKVCNTLKLFAVAALAAAAAATTTTFSQLLCVLLRFSGVPCGLLQIDFIIVFTLPLPVTCVGLCFVCCRASSGCWRFETWLQTHDYLTDQAPCHSTPRPNRHISPFECTKPPGDCLINFIMS